MTTILSGITSSFSGHGLIDNIMAERGDPDWQQQQQQQQHPQLQHHGYYGQMPLLSAQYGSSRQPQQSSQQQQYGMGQADHRMFYDETGGYIPYSAGGTTSHSPMSSDYHVGQHWPTNIDLDAASAFRSPADAIASYPSHPSEAASHRQPITQDYRSSGSAQQQAPSRSPNEQPGEPMHLDHTYRPPMAPRSATAPVKGSRKSTMRPTGVGSDDSDEDLVPDDFQETKSSSTRGARKRQRIPHTAVERRYRENLNAHLERLRQTVPTLASRQTQGTSSTGQPTIIESAKPSKCEILNGAIEHIGTLNRENQTLISENKELRTRVEDLNRWYSATMRGGSGYADPGGMGPPMLP